MDNSVAYVGICGHSGRGEWYYCLCDMLLVEQIRKTTYDNWHGIVELFVSYI